MVLLGGDDEGDGPASLTKHLVWEGFLQEEEGQTAPLQAGCSLETEMLPGEGGEEEGGLAPGTAGIANFSWQWWAVGQNAQLTAAFPPP